jgi:hypothetical protein
MNKPIIASQARTPGIGKGGHKVRGTAAQRREFYEKARQHTDEIIDRLMAIIRDEEADNGHVIQAAKEMLNRGWGAAPQVSVLEAVFTQEHTINTESLKQMSDDEIRVMEGFLARLVSTEGIEDAQVIEHEDDPA